MFNVFLLIFIGVIGLIATINIVLTLVELAKRSKEEKEVKLVGHRAKLTAKLVVLLLVLLPFYRFNMTYGTNKMIFTAEDIVVSMYETDSSEVGDKMLEYKDSFTKDGFTYVDGKDNVENILKKYKKYSSEENIVKILDSSTTFDRIYVVYNIEDETGTTGDRISIFTKGQVDKFTKMEEYKLTPILEGEQ